MAKIFGSDLVNDTELATSGKDEIYGLGAGDRLYGLSGTDFVRR
ncbi:MAG: hypothetical protein RIC87_21050 [Kiloniellales bacterium]